MQPGSASQELPTEAYPASDNREPHAAGGGMPTVDDPFNFPTTDEALPAYSAHATDAAVRPPFRTLQAQAALRRRRRRRHLEARHQLARR